MGTQLGTSDNARLLELYSNCFIEISVLLIRRFCTGIAVRNDRNGILRIVKSSVF